MKADNYFWVVVIIIIATVFGAFFLAASVNDIIKPQNNSTQFEDCKVYTIDARRAILNCSENRLLCEVMD